MSRAAPRSLLLAALIVACGEPAPERACLEPAGSAVAFDPTLTGSEGDTEAARWLAFPFPADTRRTPEGLVDLHDFPNPVRLGDLDAFLEFISTHLEGFSTNSPVYLRFENGLDPSGLPEEPMAFIHREAPLQLIDVTRDSPEYGARRPLRWEYVAEDGTYVAAGTLAVAPRWGFVLRPATTYALIATDELRDADGAPVVAPALLSFLLGQHGPDCVETGFDLEGPAARQLQTSFQPLITTLANEGFDFGRVVAATVFTTQAIGGELAAIHEQVAVEQPAPAWDETDWLPLYQGHDTYLPWRKRTFELPEIGPTSYYEMEGRFTAPNYQRGEVPYTSDSGGFVFEEDVPQVQREESLRFLLTFPLPPPRDGPCYPIVEYAHGTHGSAHSLGGWTAARLARRRLAGIGIDQPLHGERWTSSGNETLVSFYTTNVVNPEAARTVYRQSAVDTFALTRFIADRLVVPAAYSPTGEEICFDAERILFFGHSQGAFTGGLAAAHEKRIQAWLFSGGGGGEAIQFENEGSVNNPSPYLAPLLQTAPGEALTSNHPVAMLWQTLSEVNDPLNAAPHVHRQGDRPRHVLLATGTEDIYVPHTQAIALALAGGFPLVEPAPMAVPEFEALGLPPMPSPVSANVAGGRTAGFVQWAPDVPGEDAASHFVVFYREQAVATAHDFLKSVAFDDPVVIVRDSELE